MREIAICNDDFCNCAIIVSIKQLGDVAMRFRLVAFADEAAPDLAGQIEAMQENKNSNSSQCRIFFFIRILLLSFLCIFLFYNIKISNDPNVSILL